MFSPKKLGIIGLLLLNTFKIIQATELINCENYKEVSFKDCKGKTPVKYCYKDSQIYGINESNTCTGAIEDGTYVFSVNNGVTTMLNSDSEVESENNLLMYQCNTSDENQLCKRTYGYTEINSQYYEMDITSSKKVFNNNGNNEKKTCTDNSNYGILIEHQQNGASFCLNNSNSAYRVFDVNFKVVGNSNLLKFILRSPNDNEKFSSVSEIGNGITGHHAYNVFVALNDPHSDNYSDYEIIHVGKWYLCVDKLYSHENNVYVTDVFVGISEKLAYDDDYFRLNDENFDISTLFNNEPLITFPKTIYDNKNYLLKINNGIEINSGPFNTLLKSMDKPKSSEAGIVVSSIASNNNKGTPAIIAFNNFYSVINYCLDDESSEIISRRTNLCNGNISCSYYYCNSGVCTPSSNTCPNIANDICNPQSYDSQSYCDDGYYLVDNNALIKTPNKNGDLYYCKNQLCSRVYDIGFYKNADTSVNMTIPIIKCYYIYNEKEDYYYTTCIGLSYPEEKATCNNTGDLIAVVKDSEEQTIELNICLSGKKSKTITFSTSNSEPIFKVASKEILAENIYNTNSKTILKADTSSITINYGNYLISNNDEVIINSNETGKLYKCYYGGLTCHLYDKIGYYYNQMINYFSEIYPYIQCKNNKGIQCTLINVTKTNCSVPLANDDTIASDGELFITTEKDELNNEYIVYNICLDTTVDQPISYALNNTNTNKYNNYNESGETYDVLISTNNRNSIFPYKANKYLVGYINNNDVELDYRYDIFQLADPNNVIYRKYRMKEYDGCPDLDSIIEFEIICSYDRDYDGNYSYYQKFTE